MTRQYEPEGWVILQIETDKEDFFKIFGTWRGGHLDGDSWRLSSGANSTINIVDYDDFIEWPQESGSIYKLHKDGENCTGLMEPDTLIRDNNCQLIRCQYESKTSV